MKQDLEMILSMFPVWERSHTDPLLCLNLMDDLLVCTQKEPLLVQTNPLFKRSASVTQSMIYEMLIEIGCFEDLEAFYI